MSTTKNSHKSTSFITPMASQTYEVIYDNLQLYDDICRVGMSITKDDPSEVRAIKERRLESSAQQLEVLEDTIVGWLIATAKQERGTHDIYSLDNKFNNVLSKRGILKRVLTDLENHTTILQNEQNKNHAA